MLCGDGNRSAERRKMKMKKREGKFGRALSLIRQNEIAFGVQIEGLVLPGSVGVGGMIGVQRYKVRQVGRHEGKEWKFFLVFYVK